MKKLIWLLLAASTGLLFLTAQTPDIKETIVGGDKVAIAIPDLRGTGAAQNLMGAFNDTLWNDISNSGVVKMVPKTMYPRTIPQQPSDFREPAPPAPPTRSTKRDEIVTPPTGGGLWLTDWAGPPVSANYLAFGYTAAQNDVLVLSGWLFDLSRGNASSAQVIGKRYLGSVDEAGARKVAHEFAADILEILGGKSLFGTKIVFVSNRTGAKNKEIWMMDPDGSNQRQITRFNSLSIQPAISPDSTKIAFTSYYKGNPGIVVFSVDPVRVLPFYNQVASVNETPEFTPDGKRVLISGLGAGAVGVSLVVIDASTRKELKQLSLGGGAAGILMDPETGRAYVAVSSGDKVAVVDLKTLEVVGQISAGKQPDGLAWAVRK